MKKFLLVVLIITLFAAILGYRIIFVNAYINKANEHMDMGGFKLLMKQSSEDMKNKGFINTGGFGCDPYENQKDGLRIVFSGFPDVLDDYVITDIETTNSNYQFYGISVGNGITKAEDILIKNGFSKVNVNISSRYSQFENKKLIITFTLEKESKINRIRISLKNTNKRNVIF